ncbi:unnamed protein product [Boreogadus saida]
MQSTGQSRETHPMAAVGRLSSRSLNTSSGSGICTRLVLKGTKKLSLHVRSVGRIPGGYVTNHVYTWVDPQGRGVSPPPDLPEHRSNTLRLSDSQRRSNMALLQDGDEKKDRVVVQVWNCQPVLGPIPDVRALASRFGTTGLIVYLPPPK